jgi:hypothetical protein
MPTDAKALRQLAARRLRRSLLVVLLLGLLVTGLLVWRLVAPAPAVPGGTIAPPPADDGGPVAEVTPQLPPEEPAPELPPPPPADEWDAWRRQELRRLGGELQRLAGCAREAGFTQMADGLAGWATAWQEAAADLPEPDQEPAPVVKWQPTDPRPRGANVLEAIDRRAGAARTALRVEAPAYGEEAAETFRSLALGARRLGRTADAEWCWRHLLVHRPDDREARRALGYHPLDSGLWVRRPAARMLVEPMPVEQLLNLPVWLGQLPWPCQAHRSGHVTVLAPQQAPREQVQELARLGERGLRVLQALGAVGGVPRELDIRLYVFPVVEGDPEIKDLLRSRKPLAWGHTCLAGLWWPISRIWWEDGTALEPATVVRADPATLQEELRGAPAHLVVHAVLGSLGCRLPPVLEEALACLVEETVAGQAMIRRPRLDLLVIGRGELETVTLLGEHERRAACHELLVDSYQSRRLWRNGLAPDLEHLELQHLQAFTSYLQLLLLLEPDLLAELRFGAAPGSEDEAAGRLATLLQARTGHSPEDYRSLWGLSVLAAPESR